MSLRVGDRIVRNGKMGTVKGKLPNHYVSVELDHSIGSRYAFDEDQLRLVKRIKNNQRAVEYEVLWT